MSLIRRPPPPSALAKARITLAGAHLLLLGVSAACLLPLYWMLSTSLKTLSEAIKAPPSVWPAIVELSNYPAAWQAAPFGRYFLNSFVMALATAVATVISAALAGYVLVRGQLPGRRLLLLLVLASVMIPAEATFIPNYVTIIRLHWYNSFAALIVPWIGGAFSIFLFRQAFLSMPVELFEAGMIDGCSGWKAFRWIALPLSRSTALTVFLLTYLWSWNALLWPLLATSSVDMRVVQVGLVQFQTEGGVYINLLMAAVTLSILPVVAVFMVTQRLLIDSIGKGAIKA